MGIGGAIIYSLAQIGVRALRQSGSHAGRMMRWVGREILDGAARHGTSLDGMPPALDAGRFLKFQTTSRRQNSQIARRTP